MEYKDYYKILGVERTASQDDIRKIYRKLARQYHPDVNKTKGAEEKFKDIAEAYEVLGDEGKRRKYDELGSAWQGGQEFTPPPGWENVRFSFGGRPGAGRRAAGDASQFSDFFEQLFGGFGGRGASPFGAGGGMEGGWEPRGQDEEAEITISLAEAFSGARKTLSLQKQEADRRGHMRPAVRTYDVRIPAGIGDGDRIRLKGQGGQSSSAAGDLYLRVHIAPDPRFVLKGHDLETDLPVTPAEAALGAKVTVHTMTGDVTLAVSPGTNSGTRLRLRGRGMPARGTRPAGDLLVTVKIMVPKTLSPREKQLYEELARASSHNPRG
ncbi:J domain-containing protein [bacterium]|nr:J domain-containing protein [bacterium]